jgi:pilus assembly protein CpaC
LTEVSHLDPKISSDPIPGVQSNRMKTQVDARFGSPLLLSGLLQEGTREQARGLPFLRQIPILGLLFGSEDYLNERSELVAVLLPSSEPPSAPMQKFASRSDANIPPQPTGPVPLPRDWVSPERERELRASGDFPWNALQ